MSSKNFQCILKFSRKNSLVKDLFNNINSVKNMLPNSPRIKTIVNTGYFDNNVIKILTNPIEIPEIIMLILEMFGVAKDFFNPLDSIPFDRPFIILSQVKFSFTHRINF